LAASYNHEERAAHEGARDQGPSVEI
jgi:hypothetical protein